MNLNDDEDFQRAAKAIRDAQEKQMNASDEMIKALELRDKMSTKSSKDLFQRRADRFLKEYENWRRAGDGRWHGPFATAEEARSQLGRITYADKAECGNCM